jgi:hypothetical protein
MAVGRLTFTARDSQGRTRVLKLYTQYDPTTTPNTLEARGAAFLAVLQPLSNAVYSVSTGTPAFLGYGTNAIYESVADKAEFIFQDAIGSTYKYLVVAPKVAIFLSDKATIDPANTLVTAFTTQVKTYAVNDAGTQLLANFIGGFRRTGKLPKRLTSFILAPSGTTPAE